MLQGADFQRFSGFKGFTCQERPYNKQPEVRHSSISLRM